MTIKTARTRNQYQKQQLLINYSAAQTNTHTCTNKS